jgi:hypothetical protein
MQKRKSFFSKDVTAKMNARRNRWVRPLEKCPNDNATFVCVTAVTSFRRRVTSPTVSTCRDVYLHLSVNSKSSKERSTGVTCWYICISILEDLGMYIAGIFYGHLVFLRPLVFLWTFDTCILCSFDILILCSFNIPTYIVFI